jgi:hypothetical protein
MAGRRPRSPPAVSKLTFANLLITVFGAVVSLVATGAATPPRIIYHARLVHRRGREVVKAGLFTLNLDAEATMVDVMTAVLDAMEIRGDRANWRLWEARVLSPARVDLTCKVDIKAPFYAREVFILKGPSTEHIAVESI